MISLFRWLLSLAPLAGLFSVGGDQNLNDKGTSFFVLIVFVFRPVKDHVMSIQLRDLYFEFIKKTKTVFF
jgi:hypothetical protein